MRVCMEAIEHGVFAQAIRPPTVAEGSSRLRLAAMASHTVSDMREAASALASAARAAGLQAHEIGSPGRRVVPAGAGEEPFDAEFGEQFAHAQISATDLRPRLRPAPSAVFDGELDGELDVADPPRTARQQATPFDVERDKRSESDAWAA